MGCDIHGFVEFKEYPGDKYWRQMFNIETIIGRSYDAFGYLFGVRNYADFPALFPDRGTPADASVEATQAIKDWDIDGHSHSYATWAEIKSRVNPNDTSVSVDERVHVYSIDGAGEEKFVAKFGWSNALSDEQQQQLVTTGEVRVMGPARSLFTPDSMVGMVYRLEKVVARDVLGRQWQLLFKLMDDMARVYGDERVRLVVWFDN